MIFRLVTSVGQRKILNPNEESNLRPSHSALWCFTTESLSHRDMFFKHPWSVQRNKIRPANSVSLVFGMSWRHEKKPYLDFPFSLTFFPRYLLIFLKFVQAVIPTIEYDYARHFTMWSWTKSTELNPLNPKRDQHLFSPNNNTAESFIKIMRKKEMITN